MRLCFFRIPMFTPHPPPSLSEAYRSPYGEPHHYYGTRNLLDPNMAYCEHWPPLLIRSRYSTFSIVIITLTCFFFFFADQMVTCLFLVLALPCPTGMYHQGELCPASLVTTALTASTVEAASLSLQYSKYLFHLYNLT